MPQTPQGINNYPMGVKVALWATVFAFVGPPAVDLFGVDPPTHQPIDPSTHRFNVPGPAVCAKRLNNKKQKKTKNNKQQQNEIIIITKKNKKTKQNNLVELVFFAEELVLPRLDAEGMKKPAPPLR